MARPSTNLFIYLSIYLFGNFHPAVKKKEKAITKQNKTYKANIKLDEGLANGLVVPARLAPKKLVEHFRFKEEYLTTLIINLKSSHSHAHTHTRAHTHTLTPARTHPYASVCRRVKFS